MASAAGLRRAVVSETLPKGDDEVIASSSPDVSGRKLSLPPHPQSLKSRPLIHRQCVIGFVTLIAVALLVFRIGVFLVVFNSAVSATDHYSELDLIVNASSRHGIQSTSSSSGHPLLRKDDDAYDGDAGKRARPRHARILARKPLDNFRNCVAENGIDSTLDSLSLAYHSPKTFYQDFLEMACQFKIFVYPHSGSDKFANIFRSYTTPPTGNYASEHYFKMALLNSNLVTKDPSEADLFYLPFSVAMMRNDPRIGVEGIKHFVRDYVANISEKYPYWNRSGGADHFYVNCHSIGKTATEEAIHVRTNAIQVVCSSSYHINVYFPHKDATIPQVWPRTDHPKQAPLVDQRTTLAFFAGAGNSPVRKEVAKHWVNDTEIKVHTSRINTPYDVALLTSKFCLHVKGYEVNTARLADAMHYGCVPIIIADYHDLPYNDVLDWSKFSLVVTVEDIPRLKEIIKAVSYEEYVEMQKTVMQVRQHFEWHVKPELFDAFYMVMYELWLRRHVVRFPSE